MFISVLDLILLCILIFFVAYSFLIGFIQALGSLLGLILGTWLAGLFYQDVGNTIAPMLWGNQNLAYIISFIVIFSLVSKGTSIAFYFLNKAYKLMTIIPFLKTINHGAGAVFGAIEGALVLGLILLLVAQYPFWGWLDDQLARSTIAIWLMAIAKVLTPLLPKLLVAVTPGRE